MLQSWSLKILMLLCLSKIQAQDIKCDVGYEGVNCDTWICDEENKTLIYKCNGGMDAPCIRHNQICDGNVDCQYGEDENTVCQVGFP